MWDWKVCMVGKGVEVGGVDMGCPCRGGIVVEVGGV